jgi:hypothetical protein
MRTGTRIHNPTVGVRLAVLLHGGVRLSPVVLLLSVLTELRMQHGRRLQNLHVAVNLLTLDDSNLFQDFIL